MCWAPARWWARWAWSIRNHASASCTTSADSLFAIPTRDALQQLILERPPLGAKLLLAISARLAERLRDNARKLRLYAWPKPCSWKSRTSCSNRR